MRAHRHKRANEITISEARYDVLSKRFQDPQRVERIHNLNILVMDDDLWVHVPQRDTMERRRFEAFANRHLVGRDVTVRIPDREQFVEGYCCHDDGGDSDHITAAVYLHGQLLNDGHFADVDTLRQN